MGSDTANETPVPDGTGKPLATQPPAAPPPPATQEKTFTQADVDRIIKERLDREREKYADYEDLKKQLEAIESEKLSDAEKLKKAAEKAEQERQKAVAEAVAAVREAVALKKGLPSELAARLQGATKAELEADADTLLAAIKPVQPTDESVNKKAKAPSLDGAKGQKPVAETTQEKIDRLRKQNRRLFG